nr:UDP-N-acetylglucosamine 4,6-dehydratase (inverting) [Gloeomargarita lithophora]
MNEEQRILVTGGTGSFGQAFVKRILSLYPRIRRLVIFSRDELKQFEMSQKYSEQEYPGIRYFLGDIRDRDRIRRALHKIDIVIHAAALKQVPAAEYNPIEFIRTNVLGSENLIQACLDTQVKQVIALSTDKAAAPVNLYGATKLCSDKLFVAANNITGRDLIFSIVRYGNVMGSRGSVIPFFLHKRKEGILPITDPNMTRFNITLSESVDMVIWAIQNSQGGEIFVPRIPSYRITDVAEAVDPNCKQVIVGVRPGEKIHEELITASDSYTTVHLGAYFAILPTQGHSSITNYISKTNADLVPPGFSYNSGNNDQFLTVAELRHLIRRHIDNDFLV